MALTQKYIKKMWEKKKHGERAVSSFVFVLGRRMKNWSQIFKNFEFIKKLLKISNLYKWANFFALF